MKAAIYLGQEKSAVQMLPYTCTDREPVTEKMWEVNLVMRLFPVLLLLVKTSRILLAEVFFLRN